MSFSDYLILAVVGVWLVAALCFLLRPKKKHGCGGCCSDCGHCSLCDEKHKKTERGSHE